MKAEVISIWIHPYFPRTKYHAWHIVGDKYTFLIELKFPLSHVLHERLIAYLTHYSFIYLFCMC